MLIIFSQEQEAKQINIVLLILFDIDKDLLGFIKVLFCSAEVCGSYTQADKGDKEVNSPNDLNGG